MTKTMSAIALALLLGAAPMAYAQTAQHPNTMNSNPQTTNDNPYVPTNRPAIGDLWGNFSFADRGGGDQSGQHGGGDQGEH